MRILLPDPNDAFGVIFGSLHFNTFSLTYMLQKTAKSFATFPRLLESDFWPLPDISDANQYGRYGKTRAQEDARGYLKEKEDLEKDIDAIRNALISLRKKKRDVKAKIKSVTGEKKGIIQYRAVCMVDCLLYVELKTTYIFYCCLQRRFNKFR